MSTQVIKKSSNERTDFNIGNILKSILLWIILCHKNALNSKEREISSITVFSDLTFVLRTRGEKYENVLLKKNIKADILRLEM